MHTQIIPLGEYFNTQARSDGLGHTGCPIGLLLTTTDTW
jgi:hypothetical protein